MRGCRKANFVLEARKAKQQPGLACPRHNEKVGGASGLICWPDQRGRGRPLLTVWRHLFVGATIRAAASRKIGVSPFAEISHLSLQALHSLTEAIGEPMW